MDQFTESVFVESERIGRVEASHAAPAQPTAPLFIEWETGEERRSALNAEILGRQGRRLGKTGRANGYSRHSLKRLGAQPALIGEDQGKNAGGELSDKNRREVKRGSFD